MTEVAVPNGTNGTHPPETPKNLHANLALTEYTATASPPCATPREKTEHAGVPQEYLLPTGYPDVRINTRTIASICADFH